MAGLKFQSFISRTSSFFQFAAGKKVVGQSSPGVSIFGVRGEISFQFGAGREFFFGTSGFDFANDLIQIG